MLEMISLEEAQDIVLNKTEVLESEEINILYALNRILAEDVYSEVNIPPFDKSPLDGYALRAEDTIGATNEEPIILEVIDEVPAGYVANKQLEPMKAIKIMTGAPIPIGADAIIRFEDTVAKDNLVSVFKPLKHRENISQAGEDICAGELLLEKNTILSSAAIGILASIGKPLIRVYRKPRVAVLSTGDELSDIDVPLMPGKIRNSNLYLLAAAIEAVGAEPIILGIVPDRLEETTQSIMKGLITADLVISTGGVSVGDYDVVKEAMDNCGAEILFWKVAVKPGTPVVLSEKNGKLIFGLSGNPAGASIIFELLVKPVIKKISGRNNVLPNKIIASFDGKFDKKSGMRRLLRGQIYRDGDAFKVCLSGKQNPGVLKSLLNCNALIDVPAGASPLSEGDEVKALIIEDITFLG